MNNSVPCGTFLFALQTCTLDVLPTEICSVPEEKGPVLVQPPGSVVLYRSGIRSFLISFSDPSENYIPASRPAEKSKISYDRKRRKAFPAHGLIMPFTHLVQTTLENPLRKIKREPDK